MNKEFATENNFDILRLVFATLVFLFHSTVLFGISINNILFNIPAYAVQGFFIISGFLIVWSFDKNNDVLKYSIKRFFRIYPLYFILICLQAFVLTFLAGGFQGLAKYLGANLLFLNFLSPSIADALSGLKVNAINGSLWTLKIEVIFYIFLPIIYYLFKKFGKTLLIFLYILSAVYFLLVKSEFWDVLFPTHLRFFIVGTGLYFYGGKIVNLFKNKLALTLLLFLFLTALNIYLHNELFKSFIYPITLGLSVLLGAFCLPSIKMPLDISYSVYVIHFPIIQLMVFYNVFQGNYRLFFILACVIVFALSILSALFIERPFIKLGHKLAKQNNLKDFILEYFKKENIGTQAGG